jgi:endonuclease YncB( thermonuclease family)
VVVLLLFGAVALGLLDDGRAPAMRAGNGSGGASVQVTWVDGDSGRLDGAEFRLHGVDAPEGSPARAKCARERELSSGAREAARRATNGKSVKVSRRFGKDTYGRQVVDLSVDGRDVAGMLVAAGTVKRLNFDGGEGKPDWCG